MKKKISYIWDRINELIKIYDNYLFFHEGSSLNIVIDNDTISFYLFDDEKEDNFILTFDQSDKESFNYIGVKVIVRLFGNVLMYFDGITVYNKKHKENITISILNNDIKDIILKIISVQENEFINDDNKLLIDLKNKAKRKYPEEFVKLLNKRIDVSKEYLERK